MDVDTSKIEMDFDMADFSVAFVANIPFIRIERTAAPDEIGGGKKNNGGEKAQPERKTGRTG